MLKTKCALSRPSLPDDCHQLRCATVLPPPVEHARIEKLLLERNVAVHYAIIRRWCNTFGAGFSRCGQSGSPRIPHHTTFDDVLGRFAAP